MNYQPYQQPPPKKKSWIFIIGGILLISILLCCTASFVVNKDNTQTDQQKGNVVQENQQITPSPTKQLTYVLTHTFVGTGNKNTEIIHVSGEWKIVWSCDRNSSNFDYNIIASIFNSDGTIFDAAVINEICTTTNKTGETLEHKSGDIYFQIGASGSWKIEIQEYK